MPNSEYLLTSEQITEISNGVQERVIASMISHSAFGQITMDQAKAVAEKAGDAARSISCSWKKS